MQEYIRVHASVPATETVHVLVAVHWQHCRTFQVVRAWTGPTFPSLATQPRHAKPQDTSPRLSFVCCISTITWHPQHCCCCCSSLTLFDHCCSTGLCWRSTHVCLLHHRQHAALCTPSQIFHLERNQNPATPTLRWAAGCKSGILRLKYHCFSSGVWLRRLIQYYNQAKAITSLFFSCSSNSMCCFRPREMTGVPQWDIQIVFPLPL